MGMIEVTKRRQGKTMRAGAFLFELTSRSKNKNAGIQSKTFDDAKDNVFAKGVIMPFKYLPDFFIPIYDTEKGMTPKGELRFFKTNKRGANDDIFTEKVELESMITFKSSDKFAYDGMKLHRYLADEAGKTKNVDVYERHQVVQFCLQQEETIIGKALYTTTVEEMEDGGESFKALWQACILTWAITTESHPNRPLVTSVVCISTQAQRKSASCGGHRLTHLRENRVAARKMR
jgi:hypothetical protein